MMISRRLSARAVGKCHQLLIMLC